MPPPADEPGGGEAACWDSIYRGLIRAGVRPESIPRLTPGQIQAILLPRARSGSTMLLSFDDALQWQRRIKQPSTILHPGLAALAAIAMRLVLPQPMAKPRRTEATYFRQHRSARHEAVLSSLSSNANASSIESAAQAIGMTSPVAPSRIEPPIADAALIGDVSPLPDAPPIADVESIGDAASSANADSIVDVASMADIGSVGESESRFREPLEVADEEKSNRLLLQDVIRRLDELLALRPAPFILPQLDLTPRFSDGP